MIVALSKTIRTLLLITVSTTLGFWSAKDLFNFLSPQEYPTLSGSKNWFVYANTMELNPYFITTVLLFTTLCMLVLSLLLPRSESFLQDSITVRIQHAPHASRVWNPTDNQWPFWRRVYKHINNVVHGKPYFDNINTDVLLKKKIITYSLLSIVAVLEIAGGWSLSRFEIVMLGKLVVPILTVLFVVNILAILLISPVCKVKENAIILGKMSTCFLMFSTIVSIAVFSSLPRLANLGLLEFSTNFVLGQVNSCFSTVTFQTIVNAQSVFINERFPYTIHSLKLPAILQFSVILIYVLVTTISFYQRFTSLLFIKSACYYAVRNKYLSSRDAYERARHSIPNGLHARYRRGYGGGSWQKRVVSLGSTFEDLESATIRCGMSLPHQVASWNKEASDVLFSVNIMLLKIDEDVVKFKKMK